jgi:ArsR family metal-binding transcriptional regulator
LKLLDKSVNNLSQRLDKLYPETNSNNNNDGVNYWKGKKIVSIKEWKKISNYTNAFQHGIENNL